MEKIVKLPLLLCIAMLACILMLTACNSDGAEHDPTSPKITVKDGYLVVNGVKTKHKAFVEPVVSVIDGYLAINGVKTEYKVANEDHNFGDWQPYNAGEGNCEQKLYFRICQDCADIAWKVGRYEDHNWMVTTTAPTCQSGGYDTKTCTICNQTEICNETPVSSHAYADTYERNNSLHWLTCQNCDEIASQEEHTPDHNGFCTVCQMPVSSTEGIVYTLSMDGTYASVAGYVGTSTHVIIADTYNGVPVTTILSGAFYNSGLTSVKIPASITTIEYDAFPLSSSMKNVYITDMAKWCQISFGDWEANPINCTTKLFLNGELVTDLVIPEGTERVGSYAFADYMFLTSVVIPDSVTSIGEYAFCGAFTYGYNNITKVVIGNGVTTIGTKAFLRCNKLTSVTFGQNVHSIAADAFEDCNALYAEYEYGRYVGDEANPYAVFLAPTIPHLSSYTIHENTKIIACDAFRSRSSLQTVTIPKSVTSIGRYAFQNCQNLAAINYCGTKAEWEAIYKTNWVHRDTSYTVICIDGTITK